MASRVPFERAAYRRTLFEALVDARDAFGRDRAIIEDPERTPLSYQRLILSSCVLARALAARTEPGSRVGLLLPNVMAFTVVFFALQSIGRVAALLNFTAGLRNLTSAIEAAQIETIVTSRRFIETAKLEDVVAALPSRCSICYLEDLRAELTVFDRLAGAVRALLPRRGLRGRSPDDAAVMLFTSGSEGVPKGVVLTHANILANISQVRAHVALGTSDVMLNPLPVFHSFGLTVGTLAPIMAGIRVVLYPSPLHYRQVPRLAKDTGATMLLGTDTFLMGYVRAADPDDLSSIRLVIAGAERVREDTRKAWSQKSGATIIEGYGATECSPIIAANPFDANRPGTVGTAMVGLEVRLEPVPSLPVGVGRLHVRGPNIMAGYMRPEAPGVLDPPKDGWHDTGDIVALSDDGYITIQGRARRFAKIGGEMVSLAAVESFAAQCWPGNNHVVVSIPDPRKGEQLVLVTDRPEAERSVFHQWAKTAGVPELMIPKAVLVVAAVPVLGSGKIDVVATEAMARELRPWL